MDIARARPLHFPAWRNIPVSSVVTVAVLEAVVVGGSVVTDRVRPVAHRLDALGLLLLVVAGGAVALAWRRPWLAFLFALGAVTTYSALGYNNQSPTFLGLIVTLVVVADPARPRRSLAMGIVTISALTANTVARAGPAALGIDTVAGAGWVAAALLLGHAVSGHRAYVTATEERARRAEETREAEARRRVAEERLRIARELHDVVSHSISVINVQAGVAAYVLDQQPEAARAALLTIKATSKEALREMRGILGLLRDVDDAEERAPAPGVAQITALVERTTLAGLPTTLAVRGDARPLSPAVDLAAYRVAQEALTNALRHAGPATATVTLCYRAGRLELEVRDDGRGSGVAATAGSGFGLVGMRERALAAGGTLEAGPGADGGFRVCASLPTQEGAP